jgi:hypothetical protein
MVQRSSGERELYERCPSCEAVAAGDACERCGGVGFVLTGLTMTMLSQFVHQVEGLARMGGSIDRLARRGQEVSPAGRSGSPHPSGHAARHDL